MMTQKDEIDKDRHLNMVLVEFIEAVGRVAEKMSLPPPFEEMKGVPEDLVAPTTDFMGFSSNNSYNSLPLYVKIETLIVMLVKVTHRRDYYEKLHAKMAKFHHTQAIAKKKTKFVAVDNPYKSKNKIPKNIKVVVKEEKDDLE